MERLAFIPFWNFLIEIFKMRLPTKMDTIHHEFMVFVAIVCQKMPIMDKYNFIYYINGYYCLYIQIYVDT